LTEGIKEKYYNDENIARLNNIKKLASDISVSIEEIVLGVFDVVAIFYYSYCWMQNS